LSHDFSVSGFGLKCGARNCDGLTASDIAAARHMPEFLKVINTHHTRQIQVHKIQIPNPHQTKNVFLTTGPVLPQRLHLSL